MKKANKIKQWLNNLPIGSDGLKVVTNKDQKNLNNILDDKDK